MAAYTSIDGTKLVKLDFNVLIQHFKREFFSTFITTGTTGCQSIVRDMLDTSGAWAMKRGILRSTYQYSDEYVDDVISYFTDCIITSGAKSLEAAITTKVSHYIAHCEHF